MRFVESLALWLEQFTLQERRVAYQFVKERLVFISSAEMAHLVTMAYPDHIHPLLLRLAATERKESPQLVARTASSKEFRCLTAQALFLGLSDGARMDIFRRNNPHLSHEQILTTYDISPEKATEMREELAKTLKSIPPRREPPEAEAHFRTIFLLDDFSASGLSYIRCDEKSQQRKGKIVKLYKQLTGCHSGISDLVKPNDLHICVLLYLASRNPSRT